MEPSNYSRLPAMSSLVAFVEVADTLSFKRAAERVHLSPSALTRQIQALEEQLGCALFLRENPGLELTDAGRRYLDVARTCLRQLRDAGQSLQPPAGPLRLSALASFTEYCLIPRLPDFERAHPEIELQIEATFRYADFEREPVDAAIRFGTGPWGSLHAEPLFPLTFIALCSPRLQASLRTPENLAEHPLIHLTQVPDAWAAWLRSAGLPDVEGRRALRFDHVSLALRAAESDLGVALCPELLCERRLADGSLVRAFDHRCTWHETYHFVCRPEGLLVPRIRAFRDWVLASFASA